MPMRHPTISELIWWALCQGDDEEVERFQKTLDLREKGMVYVKGIFDQ